ncbi:MAG: hypothetical protein JJ916_14355 [Phycisphaerales bacterium]|nr:hypothetical protein [Phycisphaerales bacterium]
MQLYSILVITIIFPIALRYVMARHGLNELSYIMLFIYALALFTLGYPLVGTFTLLYITVLFITDYTSLK